MLLTRIGVGMLMLIGIMGIIVGQSLHERNPSTNLSSILTDYENNVSISYLTWSSATNYSKLVNSTTNSFFYIAVETSLKGIEIGFTNPIIHLIPSFFFYFGLIIINMWMWSSGVGMMLALSYLFFHFIKGRLFGVKGA